MRARLRSSQRIPFALAIFLSLFSTGCAGYRLGPTNGLEAGARSIQINLFRNDTLEPRLTEPVATAIRRQVQRDGTYRLATQGDGDIVVDGLITEFDRDGVSYDPRDTLTVRDYELTLSAQVKAVERATGRVLLDEKVVGRTTVRSGPDLTSSERQAAPLLAEDMARTLVNLLADGTW